MLEVWQLRLEALKANRLFELFAVSIIIVSALLIGIVVNVMEDERQKQHDEEFPDEPDLTEIQKEIRELKQIILDMKK